MGDNMIDLVNFSAIRKFKSIRRAIRRGHVSPFGTEYPRRPFNNRTTRKSSRPFNELKKAIYEQYGERLRAVKQPI